MRQMKYIVFDNVAHGDLIIVFPNTITHLALATYLHKLVGTPIRAGFVGSDSDGNNLRCFGESMSLKYSSQNDTELLLKLLGKMEP